MGSYNMGPNDQDVPWAMTAVSKTVSVQAFWMDETEITNEEFERFVTATGYVTTAEKNVVWEELKKQLPPATVKPDDSVLRAGSLVFQATKTAVNLQANSKWWK